MCSESSEIRQATYNTDITKPNLIEIYSQVCNKNTSIYTLLHLGAK
jgi:hypothetical protein